VLTSQLELIKGNLLTYLHSYPILYVSRYSHFEVGCESYRFG